MTYELDLPVDFLSAYLVFHVYLLKKYIDDTTSVVSLESVVLKDTISYEEVTVEILYYQV